MKRAIYVQPRTKKPSRKPLRLVVVRREQSGHDGRRRGPDGKVTVRR